MLKRLGGWRLVGALAPLIAAVSDGDTPPKATTPAAVAAAVEAQPDHLMLGIRDLDEGIRLFHEQTGVRPVVGGKHPGRGTQNALVSLGPRLYIEIIAPSEPAAADKPDPASGLRALDRLTPIGWAVSVSDAENARQRLAAAGFEVSAANPGSRNRPDGSVVRWQTFGIAKPQIPGMPFFIRWGDGVTHPAVDSPGGCRLEALRIVSQSSDEARSALATLGVDVPVERGAKGGMSVSLACPKGTVRFASE